jgi:hypothetical protein
VELDFKFETRTDHGKESLQLILIFLLSHAVIMVGLNFIAQVSGELYFFHDTVVEIYYLRMKLTLFIYSANDNCHISK